MSSRTFSCSGSLVMVRIIFLLFISVLFNIMYDEFIRGNSLFCLKLVNSILNEISHSLYKMRNGFIVYTSPKKGMPPLNRTSHL